MRTMMKRLLGVLLALSALLLGGRARAATYSICVRIPVTIDDATGKANDVGGSGNWIARGIRIHHVTQPDSTNLSGFPKFAGASNGCFSMTSTEVGTFTIAIQPWGLLSGNNTLKVRDESGSIPTYAANISLSGSGGTVTFVWPSEFILPRMYAIYGFINDAFSGNYNSEELDVWYNQPPPGGDTCNETVTENDNLTHIGICDWASQHKFLMAHEYGHANLARTVSFDPVDDCSYGNSGHGMRGLEKDSCAAMEGWAHFVAADVWNSGIHSGGDPQGWFTWWAPGPPVIDVESGQGGCVTTDPNTMNYRMNYADTCYAATDANCSGGDCAGFGTELDWMRFWWDYHTDGDASGFIPTHSDLQAEIDASGGWGSTNAWQKMLDGLIGSPNHARFQGFGDWNGNSEP